MFLSILSALITAGFLYWLIFDDIDDFLESVKYALMPDIISMLRGEWDRDWWAEFKLFIWLRFSVLMGMAVHFKFA